MSEFKYGQTVYVKELNQYGKVLSTKDGKPLKVKLSTGDIIEVINLTVLLVGLIKRIWLDIRKFFGW